jgi:processive 1,2-diacylglycerol beta-glucosyltransferase
MKKNVLILYISKFSGHYRAAQALEAGFNKMPAEIRVTKINALSYTNPILGSVINRAYLEIIKKRPEIWGRIYDDPEVLKKTKKTRDTLHRFNMAKMRKLIKEYSPEIIYCTQAFPCGMVSDYKKAFSCDIPLVGVLTDHAPHSYWLHDEVDYYVVPSSETASRLQAKGVSEEKIRVYGIPVDPVFSVRQDREKILDSLGLDPKRPTVLIMGGSQGLGLIEDAVLSLSSDTVHKYQLIVVAGSNKKLFHRLERYARKSPNSPIRVFSYVGNVDAFMDASDIVVTKAGGMTTSEAMVKGLPLVIVDPIPGHERMNADHLVGKGVAIEVKDLAALHKELNELFDDGEKFRKMKDLAFGTARPESAMDAALLAFEVSKCSTTST